MASGKAKKKQYEQYGDPPMNELRACVSVSASSCLPPVWCCSARARPGGRFAGDPAARQGAGVRFRSDRQPVAAQVPVLVNLVRIGDLTNAPLPLRPSIPEGPSCASASRPLAVFTIEAVANRSYFVRVEAVSSVRPVRTEVRLVSETDGRRSLAQSRLVGSAPAIAAAPRAQPPAPVAAPPRAAPPTAAPRAQPECSPVA